SDAARGFLSTGPLKLLIGEERVDGASTFETLDPSTGNVIAEVAQAGPEQAELGALDNGKPVTLAKIVDVGATVAHYEYSAGWPTKIEGDVIPVRAPTTLCYTRKEPVGVCGQIIPWNFPLLMAAWKTAPALARSAEHTPEP